MGPDLFQGMFGLIDTSLSTYIFDTAGNIIEFVRPIFNSLMIIWIAIWGYMTIMGQTNEPLKEGLFRILRIGFIFALALSLGTYVEVVANFLNKGPEQIAGAATGLDADSIAVTMDALYCKVFDLVAACWDKAGVLNGNFGMYVIGFGFMIIGTALLLTIAVFLISAKLMTAVLLGIGPIFIVLLLFKGTQRFFESWLAQLCNYGMILILTVCLGDLGIKLIGAFFEKIGCPDLFNPDWDIAALGLVNIDKFMMISVVFLLIILLLLQVPNVASALGGGIALGTAAVISKTMATMSPAGAMRAGHTLRSSARNFKGEKRAIGRGVQSFRKTFGRGNSIGVG